MKHKQYTIPIFVPQEGCPYKCIYCNQSTITGTAQKVDKEYVKKTIEMYLETIPDGSYVEVGFFGGSFTGIPLSRQNELLLAAKRYKDLKMINGIRLSTRPDYIDDNIIQNLLKYGVTTIELGVQSMDKGVLKASYRGHTPEDTRRAVHLIKSYPLRLGLQMMIGLPDDDYNKDMMTAMELVSMKADFVRLYPTLVIKNTYLEKLFNNNAYRPLTLEEAIKTCKDIMILFTFHNIPIIRIGLQASDSINKDADVVAGPYLPNIGEMVESELISDMILHYMRDKVKNELIRFSVNPAMTSKLIGYKRHNIGIFVRELNCKVIVIQDKKLPEGTIKIEYGNNCMEINKKMFATDAIKEGIIGLA